MQILKMEKRVKVGIKYLNKVKPNWYKKIDLDLLNLERPNVCICGQLFKNFWNIIFLDDPDMSGGEATKRTKVAMSYTNAWKRGFVLSKKRAGLTESYDILTRVWYLEIYKLMKK